MKYFILSILVFSQIQLFSQLDSVPEFVAEDDPSGTSFVEAEFKRINDSIIEVINDVDTVRVKISSSLQADNENQDSNSLNGIDFSETGEVAFTSFSGENIIVDFDNLVLPSPQNEPGFPIEDSTFVGSPTDTIPNPKLVDEVTLRLSANGNNPLWDLSDINFENYKSKEGEEDCTGYYNPVELLTNSFLAVGDTSEGIIDASYSTYFSNEGTYWASYEGKGILVTDSIVYQNARKITVKENYITKHNDLLNLCVKHKNCYTYFFSEDNDDVPVLVYANKFKNSCILSLTSRSRVLCTPIDLNVNNQPSVDNLDSLVNLTITPNPIGLLGTATIGYYLPHDGQVKLRIINSLGLTVKVLEEISKVEGSYSIEFSPLSLFLGTYFVILEYNNMVFREQFTKF